MERAPLVVERGFVGRDEAAASIESHSELPQMMIQMFVHQDRPFVWFHRPKEGMRMVGAACGASSDKLVNQSVEPDLLSTKIPIVLHHQFPGGGRIAAHRLSFPNHGPLYSRSDDPPDQGSRRANLPHRHLHTGRAMCQHLRRTHLAPNALAVRLQMKQPLLHFHNPRGFKKRFHASAASVPWEICDGRIQIFTRPAAAFHFIPAPLAPTLRYRVSSSSSWPAWPWSCGAEPATARGQPASTGRIYL